MSFMYKKHTSFVLKTLARKCMKYKIQRYKKNGKYVRINACANVVEKRIYESHDFHTCS